MFLKRVLTLLSSVTLAMLVAQAAFSAETKAGADTRTAREGKLYIYSALGKNVTEPLTAVFSTLYPGIKVDLVTMTSGEVFSRYMSDLGGGRVSADILWSGEVPLQASLVKNNFTLGYRPGDTENIMPWAILGDSSFATGFEPVVMVYNKKKLAEKDLPHSRKEMTKTFLEARYKGLIGSCDPEKNELAYLFLTQDLAHASDFWELVRSFGAAELKLFPDYGALLAAVSSGAVAFAYDVPLAEAVRSAAASENIGWYYPADYTLALPQIALISRGATNPAAAKLWIDFIMSKAAQQIISTEANLFTVRTDVDGGLLQKSSGGLPPGQNIRPAGTGSEVSRFADSGMRKGFVLRWKERLGLVK